MLSKEILYTFFVLLMGLFSYFVQKKSKSRLVDFFLTIIGLSICLFYVENRVELIIFLFGIIFGYISDLLGVYAKMWKYATKNGYSYWVGTGWGLFFLFVYKAKNITLIETLPLIIISIIISFKYSKKIFSEEKYQRIGYVIKILAFFLNPVFFLYVYSMGTLIEFIAVDLFKVWKYESLEYFRIGTGYALFYIYPERIIEYFLTKTITPTNTQLIILTIISIYFASMIPYTYFYKKRKHKNIK